MYKDKPISQAFLLVTALCVLAMGFIPAAVGGEDETEILKITVGQPTPAGICVAGRGATSRFSARSTSWRK